MSKTSGVPQYDYGQILYLLPFLIFLVLITLRNSVSYGHIFELLPVLGRTMPYFCLSILLVCIFIYRGGSLKQLGMCWPEIGKSKVQMIKWILLWAIIVLAMRIFIAIAIELLLEFLPEKISRSTPLAGNLSLLIGLLPMMWLVVIGEEILFRGLLMNYLAKMFGDTTPAWLVAILISAIVFGIFHVGKGPAAMIGSGLGGLMYGLGYFLARKNLWPVILAHCTGNTIGFIGAYFND
jgi:membrane protease YdiL (CAAX protease family)